MLLQWVRNGSLAITFNVQRRTDFCDIVSTANGKVCGFKLPFCRLTYLKPYE